MTPDFAALRGKVSPLIVAARAAAKDAQTTIDVLKDTQTFIHASLRGGNRPQSYSHAQAKRLLEQVESLPAKKGARQQIERLKYLSENVCIHEREDGGLHCIHCAQVITHDTVSPINAAEWHKKVDYLAQQLLAQRAEKLEKRTILRSKAQEAFDTLKELGIFTAKVEGMERTLDTNQTHVEEFELKLGWLDPFREF